MIEVHGLSKKFAGGVIALSEVSFTARPGEVLGFLGPNGAGKTTAMRILAGYLRPSAGRAAICGLDVVVDSLEARRRLGYLPEQVPLYGEMRVIEYLRYRAELKGMARGWRPAAIDEALGQVGLADHRHRLIGQLSKGYRQRVGLADALLHRPEVLILDEPTDGLDPNQRREVLDLVRRLARERTVVLSTHVLPEVEQVCQRVVIVDRGRVVAAGTTAELSRRLVNQGQVEIVCRGPEEALRGALAGVRGVRSVTPAGPETCAAGAARAAGDEAAEASKAQAGEVHRLLVQLTPERVAEDDPGRCCEELSRAVLSCGELQQLMLARSTLEAVFRWLTSGPTSDSAEGRT